MRRLISNELRAWVEGIIRILPGSRVGDMLRLIYWRRLLRNPSIRGVGWGARIFVSSGLTLGKGLILGESSVLEIANSDPVFIGNSVGFARGCYLRSANHRMDDLTSPPWLQGHISKHLDHAGRTWSIVIEDNVWVAANCVILTGAHIREGAVLAAGAVVSSEVPPYAVVVGNPARVVGDRRKLTDPARSNS